MIPRVKPKLILQDSSNIIERSSTDLSVMDYSDLNSSLGHLIKPTSLGRQKPNVSKPLKPIIRLARDWERLKDAFTPKQIVEEIIKPKEIVYNARAKNSSEMAERIRDLIPALEKELR